MLEETTNDKIGKILEELYIKPLAPWDTVGTIVLKALQHSYTLLNKLKLSSIENLPFEKKEKYEAISFKIVTWSYRLQRLWVFSPNLQSQQLLAASATLLIDKIIKDNIDLPSEMIKKLTLEHDTWNHRSTLGARTSFLASNSYKDNALSPHTPFNADAKEAILPYTLHSPRLVLGLLTNSSSNTQKNTDAKKNREKSDKNNIEMLPEIAKTPDASNTPRTSDNSETFGTSEMFKASDTSSTLETPRISRASRTTSNASDTSYTSDTSDMLETSCCPDTPVLPLRHVTLSKSNRSL